MDDDAFYDSMREAEESREQISALRDALIAALEYIDALPADVVSSLPAMPGFGRDEVETLLEETK